MEDRTFIPGSEWIYFKIYTGIKTADAILKNELFRYANEMLNNRIIDKWFFIRYSDPHFHIRLRLHLQNRKDFSIIFNHFYNSFIPIVESGLVWKIQCDSYRQEIERYGTNTILNIEELFFVDSEYIIRLLQQLNKEDEEQQRWKLALVLVDNYLSAFKLDLEAKRDFSRVHANNFKNEFGLIHHNQTKQLNDKYRLFRNDIENSMLNRNETFESADIIEMHMQALMPLIEKLIILEKSCELQVTMISLISSLIHMSLDRLFRTKNRLHEMVIYEFLSRYYASEIAKSIHKP